MRISDRSSDVCASDVGGDRPGAADHRRLRPLHDRPDGRALHLPVLTMHAGAIVMLAAAVALWPTYQGPVATRPVDRAGLAHQLARARAHATQDAVPRAPATGAPQTPPSVTHT